jgi:hypothetical protein
VHSGLSLQDSSWTWGASPWKYQHSVLWRVSGQCSPGINFLWHTLHSLAAQISGGSGILLTGGTHVFSS